MSKECRAIPHPGTFWAPWYRGGEIVRDLPDEVYRTLSDRGKQICRVVNAPPGAEGLTRDRPWSGEIKNGGDNAKHTGAQIARI